MSSSKSNRHLSAKVGAADLDTYFHDLRATVIRLEDAHREGTLAQVMQGERIEDRFGKRLADCYFKLAKMPFRGDPQLHRANAVQELLGQLGDELKGINAWYYARPYDPSDVSVETIATMDDQECNESAQFTIEQSNGTPPVIMSLEQMIEARVWGIGFVLDNERLSEAYIAKSVERSVELFASELDDLREILLRVLRAPDRFPSVVPPRQSHEFEQLIADILNEHSKHASQSRLFEDYCQKTDLRVQYDGLHREKGARVQVTFLSDEKRHIKKAHDIPNRDEYVLLSLWSLACAVPGFNAMNGDKSNANVDGELLREFWASIGSQPSDVAELAVAFRRMVEDAWQRRSTDPRGPMASIPRSVRKLIRIWVYSEAFRSTRIMRIRLATDGDSNPIKSRRKLAQFLRHYPEGSRVPAQVSRVLDYRVSVELPFDLFGQVRQHELSWTEPGAPPQQFFQPGQTTELVVMRPIKTFRGPAIELSLKRSQIKQIQIQHL